MAGNAGSQRGHSVPVRFSFEARTVAMHFAIFVTAGAGRASPVGLLLAAARFVSVGDPRSDQLPAADPAAEPLTLG